MLTLSGWVPFTTIDYPNHLAAVVFLQGCPCRCVYCHNPALQKTEKMEGSPSWEDFLTFLDKRKKLLDGVVFSGGEPLMQENLPQAVAQVKQQGFLIGLHTSGVTAHAFEKVLPLTDWVGLDIKAPVEKYEKTTGNRFFASQAFLSLDLLLQSGKSYEIRTTWDPDVLTKEDILSLARLLSKKGVQTFALQEFRETPTRPDIVKTLKKTSYFDDSELMKKISSYFKEFIVRRAE